MSDGSERRTKMRWWLWTPILKSDGGSERRTKRNMALNAGRNDVMALNAETKWTIALNVKWSKTWPRTLEWMMKWLWTLILMSDGSEHRNWKYDEDSSEHRNWKNDNDGSERRNQECDSERQTEEWRWLWTPRLKMWLWMSIWKPMMALNAELKSDNDDSECRN